MTHGSVGCRSIFNSGSRETARTWHTVSLSPLKHLARTCGRQGRTLRCLSHGKFRPVASVWMRDVQVLAYSREIIRRNPESSGDRCHRLSPNQHVQIISNSPEFTSVDDFN